MNVEQTRSRLNLFFVGAALALIAIGSNWESPLVGAFQAAFGMDESFAGDLLTVVNDICGPLMTYLFWNGICCRFFSFKRITLLDAITLFLSIQIASYLLFLEVK